MMETRVYIGGFGGQGSTLCGQLLGYAAAAEGKYCTYFPEYEVEMRGGMAVCTVIISNEKITSAVVHKFDYLVSMDRRTMLEKEFRLNDGGSAILNSSLIDFSAKRSDVKAFNVPMNAIADSFNNERLINIIALGAIQELTQLVNKETLIDRFRTQFAGKDALIELNIKAFEAGAAEMAKLKV